MPWTYVMLLMILMKRKLQNFLRKGIPKNKQINKHKKVKRICYKIYAECKKYNILFNSSIHKKDLV